MAGRNGKTIEITGYREQEDEDLERLKLQILRDIARNDIRILNLQAMQFLIDDLKFK